MTFRSVSLSLVGLALTALTVALAFFSVGRATKAPASPVVLNQANFVTPVASWDAEQLTLDLDAIRLGEPVPRHMLRSLPPQLSTIDDVTTLKSVFVSTMLPLIIRANEVIAAERARLDGLSRAAAQNKRLMPSDEAWLNDLSDRYGVDVGEMGSVDFASLMMRVDTIPVPLALAQAAMESGWGRSRFAQQGNALFGEWTWDANDKGIVPESRPAGKSYRVKAFDLLIESVLSYMETLNSSAAYAGFRAVRAEARRAGVPASSALLATRLDRYSEKGTEYGIELRTIMRRNGFAAFAAAELVPAGSLPPSLLGLALDRPPKLTAAS